MTHDLRFLRRLLPRLLALVALSASAACHRPDDCQLLDTCPGSLMKRALKLAGTDKASDCQQCIEQGCGTALRACEGDFACNFSARCRLTASPSDYQACIQDMYKVGLTRGGEHRYPWEGEPAQDGEHGEPSFPQCFYDKCREACVEDPFVCSDDALDYDDPRLKVAVRLYVAPDDYQPLGQISVKLCEDRLGTKFEEPFCLDEQPTDDDGIASFSVTGHISAEGMYFEIAAKDYGLHRYPRTLYYPGRLGETGPSRQGPPQLIAAYVISEQLIAIGNSKLGRDSKVLQDVAQSLLLTDSCVWDKVAAPNLRVRVEDYWQCHRLPELCTEKACPPCIWYAVDEFPTHHTELTQDWGAGIVGLTAGFYTIRVERGDNEVSARPRVRMEKGAMTIVRTWPFETRR